MTDRRTRLVLCGILLAALAVRLLHLLALRGDVLFAHPPLDEDTYVSWARAMAAGDEFDPHPYWQPPGLVYALCVIFRFAGRGLLAPRIVQALVSTACAGLVWMLSRRWFSERLALAAAAVIALHGVLVFEAAELLPATWIGFFDLVLLWLLVRAGETARVGYALGSGLALGVAALMTPVVLPFGAVAAIWLWRSKKRLALAGALVAGAIVVIAPVTLRNHRYGGEWVLVSTNGGLNFYLGNNENYASTVAIRPGKHWEALWNEPNRAGIVRRGEASSYFARKALAFVRAHPLDEAGLLLRKLYLYANGAEIPRDTDLYGARAQSPVLRALVWPGPLRFPDGILIPLALVGLALSWRRRHELALPMWFLLAQAAVTAAFFVTSRHRLPALLVLAPFAVFGAAELLRRVRSPLLVGATLALGIALNLPTREASASYAAELDFYRGLAELREEHDALAAMRYFQQATARDGSDERFWFELGNTYEAMGRTDGAITAWARAAALDPGDPRPGRRIAYWQGRRGDLDGAIAALQANVAAALDPSQRATDQLELGLLSARKGDFTAALVQLRAAAEADPAAWKRAARKIAGTLLLARAPADPSFFRGLGDLLASAGESEAAASARERAARLPAKP